MSKSSCCSAAAASGQTIGCGTAAMTRPLRPTAGSSIKSPAQNRCLSWKSCSAKVYVTSASCDLKNPACRPRHLRVAAGHGGRDRFDFQGPRAWGPAIYDAVYTAGREFGIRRMGARVASINHLEACYPTIVMDYLPAIYDADMTDYLREFEAAMPAFAKTAKVAGSFEVRARATTIVVQSNSAGRETSIRS